MTQTNDSLRIRNYTADDLEWVIERHDQIYAVETGFDCTFKQFVAEPVWHFARTVDPATENLWVAEYHGKRAGMIAIVKASEETAQLRWFLLEPDARGHGIGRLLIQTALDFCRARGYRSVILWTVSQMTAARKLYQQSGFRLTHTERRTLWGHDQTEERWELSL